MGIRVPQDRSSLRSPQVDSSSKQVNGFKEGDQAAPVHAKSGNDTGHVKWRSPYENASSARQVALDLNGPKSSRVLGGSPLEAGPGAVDVTLFSTPEANIGSARVTLRLSELQPPLTPEQASRITSITTMEPWVASTAEGVKADVVDGHLVLDFDLTNGEPGAWLKMPPTIGLTIDGSNYVLQMSPDKLTRDSTLLDRAGYKGSIASLNQSIAFLKGNYEQMKAWIADPTPLFAEQYKRIADTRAEIATLEGAAAQRRAALKEEIPRASPIDLGTTLVLAAEKSGTALDDLGQKLIIEGNRLLKLPHRISQYEALVRDIPETANDGVGAQIEALKLELTQVEASVRDLVTQATTSIEAMPPAQYDLVMRKAENYLFRDRPAVGKTYDSLTNDLEATRSLVVRLEEVLKDNIASRVASMEKSLPEGLKDIADREARVAQYEEALKRLETQPSLVTAPTQYNEI